MGLRVFEGFDHYLSTADLLNRHGLLQWTSVNVSTISSDNRSGGVGQSVNIGQNGYLYGSLGENFDEFFLSLGIKMVSGTYAQGPMWIRFMVGGDTHLGLRLHGLNANAELHSYVGSAHTDTVLWTSQSNLYAIDAWHHWQIHVRIHPTDGIFELRIDGQPVVSLTGINTQRSGSSAWVNLLEFVGPPAATGWSLRIDDVSINDTTTDPGTYPMNSWSGDLRCVTLWAIGQSLAQWTPLSGQNWQMIDEQRMDSDTTYNESITPGQTDRFVFAPLAGSITEIIGVQVTGAYRKTASGTATVKQQISSGGTVSDGADFSLPNNYAYFTDLWKLDPATNASWDVTAVNNLEAGYSLVSI